jgi:hypothetical protein
MEEDSETMQFLGGAVEGFLVPVVELVIWAFATATNQISSLLGAPNYSWLFILIFVFDVLRNLLISLANPKLALGNVIGSILGIIAFFGAVNAISHEAATSSVTLTILLVFSWIIGIIVLVVKNRNSES